MKFRLSYLMVFLLMLFFSVGAKGQTYKDGVWYSLYYTDTKTNINALSRDFGEISGVFSPTAKTYSLQYKKYSRASTNGKLYVYEYPTSGSKKQIATVSDISDYSNWKTNNGACSENISKVSFRMEKGDGLQVKNVFIPLAKHILLENGGTSASYSFEDKKTPVGNQYPTAYTIKLRSFLTNGNISITSNNGAFHFGNGSTSKSFNVGANACASANGSGNCGSGTLGKIDNYSITVYFTPTACGTNSGTITIFDGTSTATVTVSGIGYPYFDFKASAESSKKEFGSVSAAVGESRIIGPSTTTTSASTTATFTATPSSGCTFNGWYDNPDYSGNPVSMSSTYQVTLTNNTVNSTTSKTLYAKFKKNQTLSWSNSFDAYTVINGTTVANPATASSGLAVTYSSSNTDAVTVDADGTLHGVSLGKSTITVSQAGNSDYNPAESISREFTVIDKYQPAFTPSFSGTQTALKVGETATVTLANVTEGFNISAGTSGIVSWTRTGNTVTLTALKEGSTTLTLNDPGNTVTNPASAVYTITVSKVDNTLDVEMASLETTVGNTLSVTFKGRNNNDTPIVGTVSNQVLSSSVNNGSNVISYSDGVVTALNAGTATISFSQAATDKYTASEVESFNITVLKNSSSISVTIDGAQRNSINLGRGAGVPFSYTSASDAPYSVTMTSGNESIASISGSSIVTHETDGTVIWSISQPETYKYEGSSTTVRVKVNSTPEAEGYVLDENTEYSHGTGSGVVHQYTLSGPGEVVLYYAKRNWSAIYYNMYVECSADGQQWETIQDNTSIPDSKYSDFQCDIPEDARYLRFRFPAGGTLVKYIKNVKVTRKTYVRASSDKTDIGTVNTGSTGTATLTVEWSSTNGGDISIESSNPNFAVSPAKITGTANKDGKTQVTITFTPDPNSLGENTTTLTVSDLFYTQELALKATASKQGTSITKNYDDSSASSLKVDGVISDAFAFSGVSAAAPSDSPDADFHYTIAQHVSGSAAGSEHPDLVVAYDPATNKVTALNAGTATLTIYQKSTSLYAATSASFEFAVAKHDQTVSWDKENIGLILKKGQTFEDNTATASSELPVSYSSSNTQSITVDAASGVMTAVGAGADVAITASQEGNYKYNPASISRKFTVYAQSTPVFTPSFDGTAAAVKVDESVTITLENVSDGLEGDFTVTASSAGILDWTRTENVLTIIALEAGETKLTLAQKGNDDYLAKTSEYSLTVTLPEDYAILDPAGELPVAGKYRKITLKRTIPAGLSTISLPFNTSVSALTTGTSNAGAKTYVLKNVGVDSEKGYVFYFSEVAGGILEAGVPYVIYLDSEVNAPVWRSDDGIQITDNAGSTTCGAWSLVANFTAGKSMTGLYGVVNSPDPSDGGKRINRIMKGGSGAVLNAYSASFEMAEADNSTGPAYSAPMQSRSAANKASGSDDTVEAVPLFSIPL